MKCVLYADLQYSRGIGRPAAYIQELIRSHRINISRWILHVVNKY